MKSSSYGVYQDTKHVTDNRTIIEHCHSETDVNKQSILGVAYRGVYDKISSLQWFSSCVPIPPVICQILFMVLRPVLAWTCSHLTDKGIIKLWWGNPDNSSETIIFSVLFYQLYANHIVCSSSAPFHSGCGGAKCLYIFMNQWILYYKGCGTQMMNPCNCNHFQTYPEICLWLKYVQGIEPTVWVRVAPDTRFQPWVEPARRPQAQVLLN